VRDSNPVFDPPEYVAERYFAGLSKRDQAPDHDVFRQFMLLTRTEVEAVMKATLRRHRLGRTWAGLFHLMERNGYRQVRDMGIPAATSWATHLELLTEAPDHRHLKDPGRSLDVSRGDT